MQISRSLRASLTTLKCSRPDLLLRSFMRPMCVAPKSWGCEWNAWVARHQVQHGARMLLTYRGRGGV